MQTEWQIPPDERVHLRKLARRQAEYAALPIMAQRKELWYALNDAQAGARPPVVIETASFDRDFMPESVYRCRSEAGRAVERQLLRNLRNHELIDDDKVMPDFYATGWFLDIDFYGVPIEVVRVKDSMGVETAYRFIHPIRDLKQDFHRLKPASLRVDRERTLARKAFLEELFDGVLPVRLVAGRPGNSMLTGQVIALMGMEAFFLAMYDSPDELHRLMAYLRDNDLRVNRWAESEGLLCLNSGNAASFGSSFNFTRRLPSAGRTGEKVRLYDIWGCANSQETVGISPAMFHEFAFPYYRDAVEPMGLLYYGCCEPVHPFWDDIRRLPHLKKVSISRWCNEAAMAAALRGTEIIYSRKPDPNFLSVDETLDEEGWSAHIRRTLELTRGCFVEFIIRDVLTVHGNLDNARRAVVLARREIEAVR